MKTERTQITTQAKEYAADGLINIGEIVSSAELCIECTSTDCAFNNDQVCRYPLVYGKSPEITEEDGCVCSILDI